MKRVEGSVIGRQARQCSSLNGHTALQPSSVSTIAASETATCLWVATQTGSGEDCTKKALRPYRLSRHLHDVAKLSLLGLEVTLSCLPLYRRSAECAVSLKEACHGCVMALHLQPRSHLSSKQPIMRQASQHRRHMARARQRERDRRERGEREIEREGRVSSLPILMLWARTPEQAKTEAVVYD